MDTAASFNLISISLSLSLQQTNVSPDTKTRTKNFLSRRTEEEEEPGARNRSTPCRSRGFGSSMSRDRSRKQAESYKRRSFLKRNLYEYNKIPRMQMLPSSSSPSSCLNSTQEVSASIMALMERWFKTQSCLKDMFKYFHFT